MKRISVKNLIDFRKRSSNGKKTFVASLKSNNAKPQTEGGGNYWISSLSAILRSYRNNDLEPIDLKIDELQEKASNSPVTRTKDMYKQNIAVLRKYNTLDLRELRPNEKLSFLRKSSFEPFLTIKGLEVEARPSDIFTFTVEGVKNVGSIWFTAKVRGYKIEEVGLFCDLLYRSLRHNYSKQYQLHPKHCVAVDVFSGLIVNYSEIESGKVPQVLNLTLDEINKLIRVK